MVGPTIDKRIIYGFDDGELREYTLEDVKEMVDEECVAVLVGDATDGLCDGERGSAAAAGFTYVKGYPDDKAVGVLLGRVEDTLFGADVYSEHHVCLEKFAGDRTSRRRSSLEGASQQDRLGMHTFRHGDHITYKHLEEGESYETAWVYCIVYKQKVNREQARKFIVVYEPSSSLFFIQSCNSWRRVSKITPGLDPDDPMYVADRNSAADKELMEAAWLQSGQFPQLKKVADAQNACKLPPPGLVGQRRDAEKQLKEAKAAEKQDAKKRAKLELKAQTEQKRAEAAAAKADRDRVAEADAKEAEAAAERLRQQKACLRRESSERGGSCLSTRRRNGPRL